jgi:hypothetical protein
MKAITKLAMSLLTVAISGCLATLDLSSDQNNDSATRVIAQKISRLTTQRCTRYTYNQNTGEKASGDIKVKGHTEILKLFESELGWVKAEARVEGAWGEVYYNPSTGSLICGQASWQALHVNSGSFKELMPANSAKSFDEANPYRNWGKQGANDEEMNRAIATAISAYGGVVAKPTTNQNMLKQTLERSIAVSWEGFSTLIAGKASMQESADKGFISATLPESKGTCTGIYSYNDKTYGVWSLSCTNGLSAAGEFKAYGQNKGATGSGTDSKGRMVTYTISGE